jgi:hypothetical protein
MNIFFINTTNSVRNQSVLTYYPLFIGTGFTTCFEHCGSSSGDTSESKNMYILVTELFVTMDPYQLQYFNFETKIKI